MAKLNSSSRILIIILFITTNSIILSESLTCPMPAELADELLVDPTTLATASTDYGNIVHDQPAAVLYPTSVQDISSLVEASFICDNPFGISVRGNGHCTHGQDMASNGVVVDMKGLRDFKKEAGVSVSKINPNSAYADVGGEQRWIDVLNATVKQGVAPISWTDFLGLTVGGTLSNAGISGQTFLFGPQISNVLEMDVITGKGELLTCSPTNNSELFYGVLGGLGQFGIITRARIPLGPVLDRVLWAQILYSNFSAFIADQERFISLHGTRRGNAISYLEGGILLDNGTPNSWRTFFFPPDDVPKIQALVKKYGIIYSIEIANSYNNLTKNATDKEMKQFIKNLNSVPDFVQQKDVSYMEFITRVPVEEQSTKAHPWLNLFIPKSGVSAFDSGVFRNIVLKNNITTGPVLFYPMLRDKWDDRMSAVIPDEDIFYTVAILYTSEINGWQVYADQNKAILDFCDQAGIKAKQYLGYQSTKNDWIKHFGSKWQTFQDRKALFDPQMILSPGQKIFNN